MMLMNASELHTVPKFIPEFYRNQNKYFYYQNVNNIIKLFRSMALKYVNYSVKQ